MPMQVAQAGCDPSPPSDSKQEVECRESVPTQQANQPQSVCPTGCDIFHLRRPGTAAKMATTL